MAWKTKSKIIEAFCYLTTALCVASKALRFELIFQVGLHPKNYSINQQVVQEASDYRDILIQDFYEHYTNLSVKSVMILKYIIEDLTTKPHFLLKVLIRYKLFKLHVCATWGTAIIEWKHSLTK